MSNWLRQLRNSAAEISYSIDLNRQKTKKYLIEIESELNNMSNLSMVRRIKSISADLLIGKELKIESVVD